MSQPPGGRRWAARVDPGSDLPRPPAGGASVEAGGPVVPSRAGRDTNRPTTTSPRRVGPAPAGAGCERHDGDAHVRDGVPGPPYGDRSSCIECALGPPSVLSWVRGAARIPVQSLGVHRSHPTDRERTMGPPELHVSWYERTTSSEDGWRRRRSRPAFPPRSDDTAGPRIE